MYLKKMKTHKKIQVNKTVKFKGYSCLFLLIIHSKQSKQCKQVFYHEIVKCGK